MFESYYFVFIALLIWMLYIVFKFKKVDPEGSRNLSQFMFSNESLIVLFVLLLVSYYFCKPDAEASSASECSFYNNAKLAKKSAFNHITRSQIIPMIRGPSCY